jgi:hypothetical protein
MEVELRGTHEDLLHRLVREGLPELRAGLDAAGRWPLTSWVERELEAYLGCGDFSRGFAWLECDDCAGSMLVPFSCKGRAFCPACCGRRMAERAAWLVERVIPHVATRQWVLTIPWRRRWLLARKPKLALGVLRIAIDRIERWYQSATGAAAGESGAVTVIQRFGSSLALNLHFHIVNLDGVYTRGGDGRLSFRQATPHQEDVERLVLEIGVLWEHWLAKQGFPADESDESDLDEAMSLLQAASLEGLEAVGPRAGKKVRRAQVFRGREVALPPRCAGYEGYNLHAGVSLKASEREALERLLRFTLRPPLAKERLSVKDDGTVVLEMKRVWSDGTHSVEFSRADFVGKLAALVPPPRSNQTVYHGVLAGNSGLRTEVVPTPAALSRKERWRRRKRKLCRKPRGLRLGWADLLERVFDDDIFVCKRCKGQMRLRAVVVNPPATGKILLGLAKARPPPAFTAA